MNVNGILVNIPALHIDAECLGARASQTPGGPTRFTLRWYEPALGQYRQASNFLQEDFEWTVAVNGVEGEAA